MSQSSLGYHGEDDEEEESWLGRDPLPDAAEKRGSGSLRSPSFEEASTPPVAPEPVPARAGEAAAASGTGAPPEEGTNRDSSEADSPAGTEGPALLATADQPEVPPVLQASEPPPERGPTPLPGDEEPRPAEKLGRHEAADRAETRPQSGYRRYLKSRGVQMEVQPDGSETVATHADGSPVFAAELGQPYQGENGRWLIDRRDDRGKVMPIDLLATKGLVQTDPETGAQSYVGPDRVPVPVGVDESVVSRRQLLAQRQVLDSAGEAAERQAEQLAADLQAPQAAVRELRESPTTRGQTVRTLENTIANLRGSMAAGGTDAKTRAALQSSLQELVLWKQAHPEYDRYWAVLAAGRQQMAQLRQTQQQSIAAALALGSDPRSATFAATLPPPSFQPSQPDDGASTQPAETAAPAVATGDDTQAAALPKVLQQLKADGLQTVSGRPIDEAIQAALRPGPVKLLPVTAEPLSTGFLPSAAAAAAAGTLNTAAAAADFFKKIGDSLRPLEGGTAADPADQAKLDELSAKLVQLRDAPPPPESKDWGDSDPRGEAYFRNKKKQMQAIARRIQALQAPVKDSAGAFLRTAAAGAFDAYGADPNATNFSAQAGRVLGGAAPTLAAMEVNPILGFVQMFTSGHEQAYAAKEAEMRQSGETNERKIAAAAFQAARHADAQSAAALPLYMIGGKVAAGVAGKLLAPEATALAKAAMEFAGATVTNIAASSVIRALEAPTGHRLSAAVPSIESLTGDVLWAVFHGLGEYKKLTAGAKAKAATELRNRGFSEEQIASARSAGIVPGQMGKGASDAARLTQVSGQLQQMQKENGPRLGQDGAPLRPSRSGEEDLEQEHRELTDRIDRMGVAQAHHDAAQTLSEQLQDADDHRKRIAEARKNGDDALAATETEGLAETQEAIAESGKTATQSVPEGLRRRLGAAVSSETDTAANERHFAENPSAGPMAAEVGRQLRHLYTSDPAALAAAVDAAGTDAPLARYVADQHIGMEAAKDLAKIAQGQPVDPARAHGLADLGLVEPGEGGKPTVTDDALQLLPRGMREAIKVRPADFRVKVTGGAPQDLADNLTRAGQTRLESALHGRAQAATEGPAPRTFPVRVRFQDGAGQERSALLPTTAQSEEQAVALAAARVQGDQSSPNQVTHAEIERTPPENSPGNPDASPGGTSQATPDKAAAPTGGPPKVVRAAGMKDFTRAGQQAVVRILRVFQRNRRLFEALGVKSPQLVELSGETSGLAAGSGNALLLDGNKLASHFKDLAAQGVAPEDWAHHALREEFLHLVSLKVAKGVRGGNWRSYFEDIWNDPELSDELKREAAQGYHGFAELDDHQKGAEILRMILQGRWTGTITERIFKAVGDLVKLLRAIKVPNSPLLQDAVDRSMAIINRAQAEARGGAGERTADSGGRGLDRQPSRNAPDSGNPPAPEEALEQGGAESTSGANREEPPKGTPSRDPGGEHDEAGRTEETGEPHDETDERENSAEHREPEEPGRDDETEGPDDPEDGPGDEGDEEETALWAASPAGEAKPLPTEPGVVRDQEHPELMSNGGGDPEILKRAAALFRRKAGAMKAGDGSIVSIKRDHPSSPDRPLLRLLRPRGSEQFDLRKAAWLPNITETLRHPSLRVSDQETGDRIFIKQFADGTKQAVVVAADGSVVDQNIFVGKVRVQYPGAGRDEGGRFRIDWRRDGGSLDAPGAPWVKRQRKPSRADEPAPTPYHFAFQMVLEWKDFGRRRSVHRRRANAALQDAMNKDPELKAQIERLIPEITKFFEKKTSKAPKGWEWHHATEEGVMRLVSKPEHTNGSPFWKSLHIDGRGGYPMWAIPEGAPLERKKSKNKANARPPGT